MKKLLCILLFLSCSVICGCKQKDADVSPSGNVVKIGVIAPMSGPDKNAGENALLGIQTALKLQPYMNNGDTIELIIEDSGGTTEQTLNSLEKLSGLKDVSGILMMAKSDSVLAAAQVADQYKVPILALVATHPDITQNNRYISQLTFDDIFQGTVAALYVRDELLIDRVAVISDQGNAHYSFLANEFIRKFTSVDGEVVEHVILDRATTEYQEIVKQLIEKEPQLVYLAVAPEQVVLLTRAADKIGWNPPSMGSDGLLAAIILKHREDLGLLNGMMATDFFSNVLPKTEYGRDAARNFNKLFSEPSTSYAALGCEGTSILLHAMDRCDNKTNRSCVNYMLRHTEGFEGLFGKITIRDDGKAERPIFVNVIEDQGMKFVVKVY